jgi:hypothetical protein
VVYLFTNGVYEGTSPEIADIANSSTFSLLNIHNNSFSEGDLDDIVSAFDRLGHGSKLNVSSQNPGRQAPDSGDGDNAVKRADD